MVNRLPSRNNERPSLFRRPVRRTGSMLILSKHRENRFLLVALFAVQLYAQQAWLLGTDDVAVVVPLPKDRRKLQPCPSMIDVEPFKEGLVCVEECTPSANNTLQGLGLDPNERVTILMPKRIIAHAGDYGKYRVHFPEEDIHLNLTARLLGEYGFKGIDSVMENGHIHPRSITERLLRRIIAKLLRAGVLDPSKNILNTGSWIGDNALPWALLMQKLCPDNPGKVIAIDPSENFIRNMVDLAHVNQVANLCSQVAILSSNMTRVVFHRPDGKAEHIKVETEHKINSLSGRRKYRLRAIGTWVDAIPLDSLNLQGSLSLLHLDVEGHEGELLEGARATIESSRPIIITEGNEIWDPAPNDENDKHVQRVMTSLHYNSASEIPELCGLKESGRNRIWWPDDKTRDEAMAIVGKDLERQLVPWIAEDLPDLY